MKKTSRFVRSLMALLLVMALFITTVSTSALAATAYEVGETTDYVYSSVGSKALSKTLWVQVGDAFYSDWHESMAAEFHLTDIAKLSFLASELLPAQMLEEEIQYVDTYNNVQMLRKRVYNGGEGTSIWSRLTNATRERIKHMTAEQALRYIRATDEYRKSPALQLRVNDYLENTLSCDGLRAALKSIYPQFAEAIEKWRVASLLSFAKCVAQMPQYQQLKTALIPVAECAEDPFLLAKQITPEEASQCYESLSEAASYYRAAKVSELNNRVIICNLVDETIAGAVDVPGRIVAEESPRTFTDKDTNSIQPSKPAPYFGEPKAYSR